MVTREPLSAYLAIKLARVQVSSGISAPPNLSPQGIRPISNVLLQGASQARTRTRLSFERGGIILQKLHSAQGKMKKQLKSENGGGGAHFPQPGARTADQPRAPTAPNSASTRRREEKCQNPTCAAPRLRRASMDAQASGAIDGEKGGGGRKRARAHAHERERAPRAQARPAPHVDCAAVPREYTSIRNSYYSFYG